MLHCFKKQVVGMISNKYILREWIKFVEKSQNAVGNRELKGTRVVSRLLRATLHAIVLQIVPHKAKLFINIGNVFCTDLFLKISVIFLHAHTQILCSCLF
jgi:hypothetical protein